MAARIDTRRHRAALPVFTPSAVSPEALAMRTVGREAEIKRLVRAIRTAATTDNRPHQLIVGPRGSGKSHLLIVALHEALADADIADRVAVAMLPEDAVEIAGYEDLLVSIVDRAPGGDDERREAARGLRVLHDVAGLERLALQQLGDRVLILVIENLDRVFRDLGDSGQARLRNFTETSARLLLLASTPLLFDAVSDHARPWFGSFDVEHLRELDGDQGRELLRRVAAAAGDEELAASLDNPTGLARVKAVEHLAGGSPRMWTVLAGCMTVELLDELVPLVEALFDELAPYYQQRLWELAGVERKLVYELCRVRAATVKELASSTGVSQRAAATSLGRLHESRWVRREKRSGTDRRTTWYSLREPLLRHHVEYRETRRDQLPAIVGFLRDWYRLGELEAHLAMVHPSSVAERYVLAALSECEHAAMRGRWLTLTSIEDLVTAARCWIGGQHDGGIASFEVGVIAEAVGISSRDGAKDARQTAIARLTQKQHPHAADLLSVVGTALDVVGTLDEDPMEVVRRGLYAASEAGVLLEARDRVALGLLAGALGSHGGPSWDWMEDRQTLVDRLPVQEDRLRLIFMARKAATGIRPDALALENVTDALMACAARLGSSDVTVHYLAGYSTAAFVRSSNVEGLRRLAGTVVDAMADAPQADMLSVGVMRVLLRPMRPSPEWLSVWGEATGHAERLRPIHRLLRQVALGDAPRPEDLPPEDQAHLASLAVRAARTLPDTATSRGAQSPQSPYARASAVSAGSSSGGPSRGS